MCAFERVPNEQEMRKALEEKEAVAKKRRGRNFRERGGSDGAREANKLCLTRGTTS